MFRPAQGNNAYVFPGIGLGAVACRARTLPDELFLVAARTLANLVRRKDLDEGALYPPLREIRKISLAIAVSVATKAYAMSLARQSRPTKHSSERRGAHVHPVVRVGEPSLPLAQHRRRIQPCGATGREAQVLDDSIEATAFCCSGFRTVKPFPVLRN